MQQAAQRRALGEAHQSALAALRAQLGREYTETVREAEARHAAAMQGVREAQSEVVEKLQREHEAAMVAAGKEAAAREEAAKKAAAMEAAKEAEAAAIAKAEAAAQAAAERDSSAREAEAKGFGDALEDLRGKLAAAEAARVTQSTVAAEEAIAQLREEGEKLRLEHTASAEQLAQR